MCMENERYYITRDGKRMRCGYTTGSCAAAAAKAAVFMLLGGRRVQSVWLMTPKGMGFTIPLEDIRSGEERVKCAVRKDAGDDPDITNGMLVYAEVEKYPAERMEVCIDGGIGVGRVTRPGLDQPVGSAAINSVPRRMITEEILSVAEDFGYKGGIRVIISIPEGEELAKRTFNPRLGIVGGLSVLGTTGIVEPMSDAALIDTVRAELSMCRAAGRKNALLTPGNYGEEYIRSLCRTGTFPGMDCAVKVSNFIGDALELAVEFGFEGVLLVGHIGKFVKLAGGLMNTHSRYGDCRAEIITAHAAMAGAGKETAAKLMNSVTTEDMLDILEDAGLKRVVMQSIVEKIAFQVRERVHGCLRAEILTFSNQHGFLGATDGAGEVAEAICKESQADPHHE